MTRSEVRILSMLSLMFPIQNIKYHWIVCRLCHWSWRRVGRWVNCLARFGQVCNVSFCQINHCQASEAIIRDITSTSVTANFHHWCLTKENFTLWEFWRHSAWSLSSIVHISDLKWISSGIFYLWTKMLMELNSYLQWRQRHIHFLAHNSIPRRMLLNGLKNILTFPTQSRVLTLSKNSFFRIFSCREAVRVGGYFGQFFVNLARQSSHKFNSRSFLLFS